MCPAKRDGHDARLQVCPRNAHRRPQGAIPSALFDHCEERAGARHPARGCPYHRWMSDSFLTRLESLGVEFEIIPCDPDLADTAAFCEAYGYALEDSANTIVVAGKGEPPVHAACVVLATTRLDVNKVVRKRLGVRRASFAGAEQTRQLTGMEIGGVTPVGLPTELPLWVDACVMGRERIILGGGSRERKVLAPPSLLTALGAEVVDGLARDPA
jgi:prolyl-tRNA editing enzyme YbaK/EbsC (Cys-tRNA(Pro) deacylase)